jgi:pentatricopeptide repeat protein
MLVRTLLLVALGLNCKAACEPAPEIQAEFQKAAVIAAAVADPFAAFDKAAAFLGVRDRHPDNLFAHERYQDAVNEYGIEGHLRLLNQEYQELDVKHPGHPMYHYLYLRTLAGRGTFGAIQGLNDLLASHPDFAPAHRTLAEIYATEAFRDAEKEKLERARYRAGCPGGKLTNWPPPIPDPSPLIDQAERSLAEGADPEHVIAMTIQGLKEFEWRSQRIRAFDWYTLDYKRRDLRELRGQYWRAWGIQVRCYRKNGQLEKAEELLAAMRQRAMALADPERLEQVERLRAEYPARIGAVAIPRN